MTRAEAEVLAKLARQFPQKFIHGNPSGGGSYVAHPVIRQRLLATFGLYDFELVQILRGTVAGKAPNPQGKSDRARAGTPDLEGVVVGAVCRLTVPRADGRMVSVEDVGNCEAPHNWPHDGARLKDAMSDALKRCAMNIGVALHLWCKPGEFRLDAALEKMLAPEAPEGVDPGTGEVAKPAPPAESESEQLSSDEAEGEVVDSAEPEPLADGMVETRAAKKQLLEVFAAAGVDDPKAAAAAAWKASKIAAGPIPQRRLDVLLADAADPERPF
jgi:hypothetical protein